MVSGVVVLGGNEVEVVRGSGGTGRVNKSGVVDKMAGWMRGLGGGPAVERCSVDETVCG